MLIVAEDFTLCVCTYEAMRHVEIKTCKFTIESAIFLYCSFS